MSPSTRSSSATPLTSPPGTTSRIRDRSERQSSSGVIVATGTGQTGWSRSIRADRHSTLPTPNPTEPALTLFVREAWPSIDTGADLTEALIGSTPAQITSRMEQGGVVFGDGIETDHLDLPFGARAKVAVSGQHPHLVI